MRSKFSWFVSAGLLWAVFCLIGLVGMAFKALDYMFESRADSAAVMTQGAEWMLISSLAFMSIAMIAAFLALSRLRLRLVLLDLGLQGGAILFGSLYVWTLAQDARFLIFWTLLYAGFFLKPFVLEKREGNPPWRRWGLVGLTVLTAASAIVLGAQA